MDQFAIPTADDSGLWQGVKTKDSIAAVTKQRQVSGREKGKETIIDVTMTMVTLWGKFQ